MNFVELLSPAGDVKSFKAAILAGANAIFFGVSDFNARQRAENISFEKMEEKTMKTIQIKVEGMMCPRCEAHVVKALMAIDGVENAVANHQENIATITLTKDVANDIYVLALSQSDYSSIEFSQFCNMLHEYGCPEKISPAALAYLEEHCEVMIAENALQKLSNI